MESLNDLFYYVYHFFVGCDMKDSKQYKRGIVECTKCKRKHFDWS